MTIKPVIYIVTAASLAFATPASAQSWGSTGAVTVALTLTYQTEALKLKDEFGNVLPDTEEGGGGSTYENTYTVETLGGPVDERVPIKSVTTTEYGSKLGVWRWGNAQIIQSLVGDGTLPEIGKPPFLAGWSIVMVFDKLGNATGVVARHTNKTTVPINFAITPNAFEVAAINSKEIVTNNTPLTGSPSTTETRTYSKSYKRQASASLPSYTDEPFNLSGLLSGGFKVTPKKGVDDETGETITTFVYSPNATRLDRLLGVGGFDPFQDLIEGSISMSAGVIVDLDDFFPTPLE
jgi:hypothetical protein